MGYLLKASIYVIGVDLIDLAMESRDMSLQCQSAAESSSPTFSLILNNPVCIVLLIWCMQSGKVCVFSAKSDIL